MQTVTSDDLIDSLIAALADRPDDVPLRLHLAGLLLDADRPAEALSWISSVLAGAPAHPPALILLSRASNALIRPAPEPVLPSLLPSGGGRAAWTHVRWTHVRWTPRECAGKARRCQPCSTAGSSPAAVSR
jgi:hypothetical protein